MTRDIFTFGLGLGAILITAQAARAETPSCLDREDLAARLADQYGEQRQSAGLAGPDRLVEVFASPETGTWTIVVTSASGVSCLIAAGEHFTRFEGVKAGDPA